MNTSEFRARMLAFFKRAEDRHSKRSIQYGSATNLCRAEVVSVILTQEENPRALAAVRTQCVGGELEIVETHIYDHAREREWLPPLIAGAMQSIVEKRVVVLKTHEQGRN